MKAATVGRPNQRRRTRKDLLQAAARLMQQGRKPTLEEIAAEAMVSRATAYRYFPSIEALYTEASLDLAAPEPEVLFHDFPSTDPAARIERVDTALHEMILQNELSIRMMLAHSMERIVRGGQDKQIPPRQNRRSPLIEAALKPTRSQFKPASLDLLSKALAMIVGTEAMIVFKDVLQLPDAEAMKVKRWTIRTLVEAARK